jgi:hypothetical protein
VDNFEGGDYAYCRVSSDNLTWHTVYTWDNKDDDNTWHFFNINITPYGLTGDVRIAFVAAMDKEDDYLYIDDVSINAIRAYCITVNSGDRTLKAAVDLMGGIPTVLCWWFLV